MFDFQSTESQFEIKINGETRQIPEAQTVALPRCADPDDQPFIDLAVTHGALLLSKDAAVLGLTRRLRAQGIHVMSKWPPALAE